MDKKISQLGATTTPVNADLFAIVQSGVTKKITYQNLVAAIVADTSLDLNQVLTNGNITGGKNIKISLNDVIQSYDTDQSKIEFGALGDEISITTDNGGFNESWIYSNTTENEIGFDNNFIGINQNSIYNSVLLSDLSIASFGAVKDANLATFFTSKRVVVTETKTELKHPTSIVLDSPIYKFSQLTIDTVPYIDTSNNLVSSGITPTELGYLTGASSNLQAQIDALVTGLSWKQAVRVATTGPGTLASDFENGDTIDGVVLATGDRILIKDQASAIENGIYIVNASGAPTRASDMNTGSEFPSATVAVSAGTANQDTQWVCTNDSVTIGVTNISFVAVGGTTYVGTTNKITVTGNVIDVGAYVLLSDGSVPLIANWDAGDFEIKFTDFKAKTSSGGSLVSSGGNDCFLFGAGGGATNTAYGGLKLDYSTASTIAIIDSNKNLISADTTTYPSLTELSYLKGSTSAIQTQLDSKNMSIMTTHNAYSPVDGVTDYVGLTLPVSPQTTVSASLFKIYGNKTVIGAVITWRVANAFSNESVSIYLRNNTDAVDNTITTTLDLSQAAANTSYSQIITGLNISTSTVKDYTIKRVMPTWGTNGTNLVLTVQLITN